MTTLLRNAGRNGTDIYELLDCQEESLGFGLGSFLLRNNFGFEKDDLFRILASYGSGLADEVCLQYFLFGNGRRNLPAIAYLLAGTFLQPQKWDLFYAAFKKGRKAHRLHDVDFSKLLRHPVVHLRECFNIHISEN